MASIAEKLKRIVIKKAKLANGKTVEQNLKEAVDYLYDCIQDEIDFMYDSYSPSYYKRRPDGANLRTALYAEDFIQARIKDNRIELSLKFSNNVWAWNFNKDHRSPVNVLMLNGWCWHGYTGEEDRFRRFDGYDYIDKGVQKFNANNRWGVTVSWDVDISDWY